MNGSGTAGRRRLSRVREFFIRFGPLGKPFSELAECYQTICEIETLVCLSADQWMNCWSNSDLLWSSRKVRVCVCVYAWISYRLAIWCLSPLSDCILAISVALKKCCLTYTSHSTVLLLLINVYHFWGWIHQRLNPWVCGVETNNSS